jgi:lipopolysaccharide export system protein LptA
MVRPAVASLGIALVLAAAPSTAQAQQVCDQVLRSDFRRVITQSGQEIMYYRNPVRIICTSGVQIEADSAVMNRTANTLEMVGRVLYRDGERQLTSDWAHYVGPTDELFARGSVVLTDRSDGSIITGENFEYRRQTEARPEAHMSMTGGRPHAVLPPGRELAEGEVLDPIRVWGERMEMLGDRAFIARTDVEIQRGDLRGASDEVRFDQLSERIILTGRAHVETDEYRLDGERIDALVQADTLREVLAEREARLAAEDLTVYGHTILISFADGQPERVEAWNPADAEDAPPPALPRAMAISADFQLRADSIDARSDVGRLREVRAVGRAYGEREADTLAVELPDAIARDWIQGDTIIGYFADVPAADAPATDVAALDTDMGEPPADETVLERIEVIGGSSHALSLYRSEDPDGGPSPAVNFMRATRITLFMHEGEVGRVEADGPIEGVYLDPAPDGRAP